jgi:5-methylcytosine-specific restriction endonuclease McrA
MAGNVVPMGRAVNGASVRAYDAAVFAEFGTTCHLCGLPGANTVDHIRPQSTHPELRWELSNGRPAHRSCNSARKARPLASSWTARGW